MDRIKMIKIAKQFGRAPPEDTERTRPPKGRPGCFTWTPRKRQNAAGGSWAATKALMGRPGRWAARWGRWPRAGARMGRPGALGPRWAARGAQGRARATSGARRPRSGAAGGRRGRAGGAGACAGRAGVGRGHARIAGRGSHPRVAAAPGGALRAMRARGRASGRHARARLRLAAPRARAAAPCCAQNAHGRPQASPYARRHRMATSFDPPVHPYAPRISIRAFHVTHDLFALSQKRFVIQKKYKRNNYLIISQITT